MTQKGTKAVRAGIEHDTQYGAVIPPIYLSTNYGFKDHLNPPQFDYSRSDNPTRDILAKTLAQLEGGISCAVTSTGMSAVTLVTTLLKPNELVVIPDDCYGGTYRIFTHLALKKHFELLVINMSDLNAINKALELNPKMIWLETPSNPLLNIVDIASIAEKRKSDCLLVVDNTFLSPIFQNPLSLGADIVVHSTTKYINGHSDIVGGAVISGSKEIGEQLLWWSNALGLSGSAFDNYLTLRGLRTLKVRIEAQALSAQKIAEFLNDSPYVNKVYYPGLKTHPNHEIALKQQTGFGAIISFELSTNCNLAIFLKNLKLFSLAESLGGVESLVAIPATMTHRAMGEEALIKAGIKPTLIRLSIGLEDTEDLINDFKQSFITSKEL